MESYIFILLLFLMGFIFLLLGLKRQSKIMLGGSLVCFLAGFAFTYIAFSTYTPNAMLGV
ncbi:hypothetical protein [Priestia koreensis]|uniref:hypothetical protein n=1 Tax=Priestia koreensis TaxID=284581 RepID=UPI001F568069|nr:hypothetical protein [Priestia koreensis]MCM3004453.1 hypothetical protein [Priestia koreensis]UNL84663.1 hypothetical protein IE339_21590 [Priestia koreensis]